MIRVEKLEIQEFRGIRNLVLDLKGENFAICGPNGTGKSGIVDALEFALTGNISRLSGRGTGELSVKEHAPHVDSRNDLAKARVVLSAIIPKLNKRVRIERCVKDAELAAVTPSDTDVVRAAAQVATHPEFTLSRRELIRYVLTTPGDRAKEVQSLLRLDKLEDLRTALQRIANSCERQLGPLGFEKKAAREQLMRKLEIADLNVRNILQAVNPRRVLLGLRPLELLTAATSLKDGLATLPPEKGGVRRIPKDEAIKDIKHLRECLTELTSHSSKARYDAISGKLGQLEKEPGLLDGVKRETFLNEALRLVENGECPVCDTKWEPAKLREIVADKLIHLENVAKRRKEIEREIEPVVTLLIQVRQAVVNVYHHGLAAKPPVDTTALQRYARKVDDCRRDLEGFLPVERTIFALGFVSSDPGTCLDEIDAISRMVEAIPEQSKQDAARDYLTSCQERFEAFQDVSRRLKKAEADAVLSKSIYSIYGEVSTSVLNEIYRDVQTEFTELYKFINRDDEGQFDSRLIPSIGKLGFHVDFYGRGFFPPGAYHSEGHQDGMGLCLYLALMKHLLGCGFTFAVLDDVLMSVDSGHRREVCRLLREKFEGTQFILTTHDEVWLRHMKSAGLIKSGSFIQFRRWDVDQGPTEWEDRDVWAEIEASIECGNILRASSVLRNYLEYVSAEVCNYLRARVEFRADAQYQLGDLLPNAVARFRKLLKEGKRAAQSWGKKEVVASIEKFEEEFAGIAARTKAEEWQMNPAIHSNAWANFGKEDFGPVVMSFRALVEFLRCARCEGFFYVIPERGTEEMLRCSCGAMNMNLVVK